MWMALSRIETLRFNLNLRSQFNRRVQALDDIFDLVLSLSSNTKGGLDDIILLQSLCLHNKNWRILFAQ